MNYFSTSSQSDKRLPTETTMTKIAKIMNMNTIPPSYHTHVYGVKCSII